MLKEQLGQIGAVKADSLQAHSKQLGVLRVSTRDKDDIRFVVVTVVTVTGVQGHG